MVAAAGGEGKIEAGDEVVEIDGVQLAGLDDRELTKLVLGLKGSIAELLVRPACGGGAINTVRVRRESIIS